MVLFVTLIAGVIRVVYCGISNNTYFIRYILPCSCCGRKAYKFVYIGFLLGRIQISVIFYIKQGIALRGAVSILPYHIAGGKVSISGLIIFRHLRFPVSCP